MAPGGDTRCFYVLQLEVDLLTGSLLPSGGTSDDTRGPEDGPLSHSMYRVLGPGVNEEAISRVWLAKRDSGGTFLTPVRIHDGAPLGRCTDPAAGHTQVGKANERG